MPHKSKLNLKPILIGDESIGKRIAKLRKSKGLTQQQLALKMGILNYLISDYETERRRLYDEMLIRFAIALEVSLDYLVGLSDDPKIKKRKTEMS
jgi:transcriptional regulator with XRE-family HTH domain